MNVSKVTCILNEAAGSRPGAQTRDTLARLFAEHRTPAHIVLASRGAEIPELARRAVKQKTETIVAGGGDGTVNAVASQVVGTPSAFGIIPLGTLNHFARDARIPMDLQGAVRCIVNGHIKKVDVGQVNGHIFLNNSSLGIYPLIVRQREEEQKAGRNKWWAFARAIVSVLSRYSLLRVHIQVDQQELVRDSPFVFVGNNEYQVQSFHIGERLQLDGGNLCVYVANRCARACLVRLALQALLGRLREASELDAMTLKQLVVRTRRRRMSVATDGEVRLVKTPLEYRILPHALQVIVPPSPVPGGRTQFGRENLV
ncbi:MAG TPA: diacylglycerol kinase family protein [Candidatus Dormibacteraeota bacterium]|nr:diacylglycerol kinase family protein [Candidatus Dormibacteraeota bacterium]